MHSYLAFHSISQYMITLLLVSNICCMRAEEWHVLNKGLQNVYSLWLKRERESKCNFQQRLCANVVVPL